MTALDQIMSFLQGQLGLTPAQAAGVAGNFQVESGFNPAAYNPKEGAVGLAQWEGGREQALRQFAQQNGTSETDLTTQLQYMAQELSGPESRAYTAVKATSDPASAAAAWDQYFERSAGTSRTQRIADAQAIANGNPTTTGPAGSSSSSTSTSSGQSVAASIGGWMGLGTTLFTIGVKVLGAAAAAALVIVGATHTVSDK
jgi:hypothetical protein